MNTPKIRIKTDGFTAKVFVDDNELKGVRAVRFSKKGLESPVFELEMKASDVEIEANIIPALPEVFRPFYIEKDLPENDTPTEKELQAIRSSKESMKTTTVDNEKIAETVAMGVKSAVELVKQINEKTIRTGVSPLIL